jgi:predicted ester cyclase
VSEQENKEIVRRWNEETYNERNLDVIDELAAADYINHSGDVDRARYKAVATEILSAYTDGGITLGEIVAQGDMVAVSWRLYGTHTGEYMGVPPTGREEVYQGVSMYRIADGKIVEDWSVSERRE